ncbi:hypothetical protein HPP92_005952 [Vanilla planifolia]|uniref:Smr domain-containing protein n=1 Tax=Vanilla planifolia TaxID=51239 RepID=A0A835RNT0_VANPL|nr:hypothetical protein HPP92_005952 [Vanilla planifolia]
MFLRLGCLRQQVRRPLLPFLGLRSRSLNPKHSQYYSFTSVAGDGEGGNTEWTDDIVYLDESGGVIDFSRGLRPTEPGIDSHVMVGGVRKPLSDPAAVAKIVEISRRWRWGPDLHSHLDRLPFTPSPIHLHQALSHLSDHESSLSLFRWACRQPWFSPSDESYAILFDRLNSAGDLDSVHSLFDDIIADAGDTPPPFPSSLDRAVQYLARADRLEVSFFCFKKLRELGFRGFSTKTYNCLITLFLGKGLPYKSFEIYEFMEGSGCPLDSSTYELMIPALARSGRLDAALRLFQDSKSHSASRPGFPIYSALVDSMGKAGRLDAAVGLYREMLATGYKPSVSMYVSMIESLVKAGKLDAGLALWEEMKAGGFRPNFALYTMMVEAQARSGRLDLAATVFTDMEKAGFLPTPSTYASLIEMHSAAGQVDPAMRLYNSMINTGLRPGLNTYTSLVTVLANKKLLDLAAKILLEMKSVGYAVDVNASDVLMIYIKEGSTDMALRWLRFMGSAGIRTNNFIIRQLFESCMKAGLYESASPLLETYLSSSAKVDLILYTSILAHLVRCQDEKNERAIMYIMSVSKHKAHWFLCGLFTGTEQRKKSVLALVREFFQEIDYETEESAARNLSVGAALVAVVHTLHRFRKRMLYYGVVPRRIKLVTGSMLKMVVAQMLASVESPFEVSKVVLRAPGDLVLDWFKKPIVQQFLLNEIPSKSDVLMHKLNVMFPSSAPEVRSRTTPKLLLSK